jgi:glycosyltransferase involved in cell wall biosynthesis
MKILLLTDMPPCKGFTAGLVTSQLVRFLPKGSVACYAVVHSSLDAKLDPEFEEMPIRYAVKPRETGLQLLPGRLRIISSFAYELYTHFIKIPKLLNDIEAFAKEFGADRIWCVLEGQTMFRLAVGIKKRLNLPLHTQVWDPPGWWLRANSVDTFSRKLIMKTFDEALRMSKTCAAASWAMAEDYKERYSCHAIPVIPSLDPSMALPPAKETHHRDTFMIGMAGQLYSQAEWLHLLATLDQVKWMIRGKKIVIRLLGRSIYAPAKSAVNIEFLGWVDQTEAIKLLSEADILYCPYWFDPAFHEEARYSFPSKLTTYLAVGRPVLFHGPKYASPYRFLDAYDAGILCDSLSTVNIFNCIDKLIWDQEFYNQLTENGHKAFMQFLTTDVMRQQFKRFIGYDDLQNVINIPDKKEDSIEIESKVNSS